MNLHFFIENEKIFFAIFVGIVSITLLLFKYFAPIGGTKDVMEKVVEYFRLFFAEFLQLIFVIREFIKTFHAFFSLVGIIIFFSLNLVKPLILLVIFELKMFLVSLDFFKAKFETFISDERIIKNHWDNDLDLQYLSKFLSYFRISISFFLIMSLNGFFVDLLAELKFTLKPIICWDLLILSYFIEMIGEFHVIFFRNTRVAEPSTSTASAFLKGFTKLFGLFVGKDATNEISKLGTKIAENPSVTGAAAGAGAVAGAVYEKSKHPIIVELGKKEIASDNSLLTQTKQYFLDGAIHCDPHSNRMYNLLDKHFKGIVKISDLCEKGMISQEKIRERFLTDPAFESALKKNPHCFQPFGLGDKMIPSEAHAANEKNKILHGEQGAKDMGLIIDYIPAETSVQQYELPKNVENFTLNFKKPVSMKDLPGFDPKDPTKNLPHIADTSNWFKPKGSKN